MIACGVVFVVVQEVNGPISIRPKLAFFRQVAVHLNEVKTVSRTIKSWSMSEELKSRTGSRVGGGRREEGRNVRWLMKVSLSLSSKFTMQEQ